MAWLMREGEVLASVETVSGPAAAWRVFAGREHIDGALFAVLGPMPMRLVSTYGARCRVDLVLCDAGLAVLEVLADVAPGRITRPRLRACRLIGGEAGFSARHAIHVGDGLEIRG